MKKSENKIHLFLKTRVSFVLLFLLALLLLIVSCPIKRFLKSSFGASSTTATRSNQTNSKEQTVASYSNDSNSCSVSEEPVFTTDFSQPVKLQVPENFANIINEPGFNIHYFLSGINYRYHSSTASLNSPLPLFLQHLRLLI